MSHWADAAEAVRFDSAAYLKLTSRQSLEEHIPIFPPAPILVQGYVLKPAGDGPFPAVVVLHGCAGLGTLFDPHLRANAWPDMLVSWGYAVLIVDSYTPRGIRDTCYSDARYYRLQD